MSLLLVDEIREHTSGAGILVSSRIGVGVVNPQQSGAFQAGMWVQLTAPDAATSVFSNFVSTPETPSSGTFSIIQSVVVGDVIVNGTATVDSVYALVVGPQVATANNHASIFVYGTTATASVNTGMRIVGISGGTVNNYGIIVGDVTGTGAYSIYTGAGTVRFGGNLRVDADNVAHVGVGVSASTDVFGGADNPATPKCAFRLFASRGTGQSPTALQAGDWAGVIYFLGYAQTGGFGGGPVMAHIQAITVDSSVVAPSAFMRIGVNAKPGSFSRTVATVFGHGVSISPIAYSGATTELYGMQLQVETEATSFTIAAAYGLLVDDAVKGAGSTITTQYGIRVLDQTKGATNYAIYTGTGSVRFGDTVVLVGQKIIGSAGTHLWRNSTDTATQLTIADDHVTVGLGYFQLGNNVYMLFSTANARLVGGATDFAVRNAANSADNILVTDAGAVTIRSGLTVSAGNITSTAGVFIAATTTAGPHFTFSDDPNTGLEGAGSDVLRLTCGGSFSLIADADATADNMRVLLFDASAGSAKRVSRGAVDSGGTGFRVLRIPN